MATVSVSISLSFRHVCMKTVYGCACIAFQNHSLIRSHFSAPRSAVCAIRFSSGCFIGGSYEPNYIHTNLHTPNVHCTYVAPTNPVRHQFSNKIEKNKNRTLCSTSTPRTKICDSNNSNWNFFFDLSVYRITTRNIINTQNITNKVIRRESNVINI